MYHTAGIQKSRAEVRRNLQVYRVKSVICLILWRRYVFVYDGYEDREFDVVLLTCNFISNLLQ